MANNDERLVYQITVTNPGYKVQNWYGTLFDKDGNPIEVAPGETVKTHIGEFINVAESRPYAPYGMIHVDMVRWMETEPGNVVMDMEPWAYRLYVAAEGSRSEGWRGELAHGSTIGQPAGNQSIATPMGPYVWKQGKQPWDPKGWFHVSWAHVDQMAKA